MQRRDTDLIRQLLFRMEDHSGAFAPPEYAVEGYTADQVGYHVWLLGQAGLMKVIDVTSHGSNGPQAIPLHLAWEGHDFIAAARSDTTWAHVKEKAKSAGAALTFAVIISSYWSHWPKLIWESDCAVRRRAGHWHAAYSAEIPRIFENDFQPNRGLV